MMLAIIDRLYPADEFDARSLWQYVVVKFPILSSSVTTKLVSNDLNRLYRMQLLSRRKAKRTILGGEICRGFMYVYWLNKQGKSYIDYLKRTFFHPDFEEYVKKFALRTNVHSALTLRYIEKNIGEKTDDLDEAYAEYLYLYSIRQKGRHKRFPTRVSFEFVKALMEQKRKLEQENEKLMSDLEICRTQLEITKRRSS